MFEGISSRLRGIMTLGSLTVTFMPPMLQVMYKITYLDKRSKTKNKSFPLKNCVYFFGSLIHGHSVSAYMINFILTIQEELISDILNNIYV